MKTVVDERLLGESARFAFRFACEDCEHVCLSAAPSTQGGGTVPNIPRLQCSLGYPATPSRDAIRGAALELCKGFELGPV